MAQDDNQQGLDDKARELFDKKSDDMNLDEKKEDAIENLKKKNPFDK